MHWMVIVLKRVYRYVIAIFFLPYDNKSHTFLVLLRVVLAFTSA